MAQVKKMLSDYFNCKFTNDGNGFKFNLIRLTRKETKVLIDASGTDETGIEWDFLVKRSGTGLVVIFRPI